MKAKEKKGPVPRAPKSDADKGEAIASLNAWADASSTAVYNEGLHVAVGNFLLACADRPSTILDPFQISLA